MLKRKPLFLLTILCATLLSACSSKKDGETVDTEQALYEVAQDQLEKRNWDTATEALHLLEENFPFGVYAEQAQLELIFAYYRTYDYELAIAAADRFIRLHPQHRNVDYAYYMRGVASFYSETAITTALISDVATRDSGSAKDSFNYFSQLLNRYPESIYALDARQRMIYLRNILARQEIHVANYYFRRGAFVAAASRGKYVVENMQGTPAVPDGIAVMAQAYHLLDMQDLADNAVRVLKLNYPEHPSLDEQGNFQYSYKLKPKRNWLSYLTLGVLDKSQFVKFDSRDVYNPQYRDALKRKDNDDDDAKAPPKE
ncbi:MAG: outer membrane protein assembly factor BamD [Agarilytica sp.]